VNNDEYLPVTASSAVLIKESKGVKVYPNPIFNDVSIEVPLSSQEKILVNILDQNGRIIKSECHYKANFVVDLSVHERGVYSLHLVWSNNEEVFKIVKL
jgi:hypothetical protein